MLLLMSRPAIPCGLMYDDVSTVHHVLHLLTAASVDPEPVIRVSPGKAGPNDATSRAANTCIRERVNARCLPDKSHDDS